MALGICITAGCAARPLPALFVGKPGREVELGGGRQFQLKGFLPYLSASPSPFPNFTDGLAGMMPVAAGDDVIGHAGGRRPPRKRLETDCFKEFPMWRPCVEKNLISGA